ncbi:YebC/PmpR family DNA-binding transcriptional regulator [Labilibaculum sp. DW002]|uniref:Probable transcriptional regulatory protein L3049_00630 n=1 Tax=Paralabilibaculum antarcticum TaxID=2912572 RepID=A0ABT5VMI4_9BACT|nr:YebC/PmpR family DNA-binding transcriptional regulator [Labilibaculum sp. DW002]MDE5416492.1 YebC/PmpR family DNA-binding transcriptional regulator [Labilibaculum sp. DW002]
MGRAFEFRKARKFKRWDKMAKTFTRIGKEIVIAIKEGGPDPTSNSRLRAVIQNARAANMPKENVERAIKKATSKDQKDFKEIVYEGYAPHGIAVLVETATDNHMRTVADVRSYFSKTKGSLGTTGSVEFMFEHKCHFKIENTGQDLEELELEVIDLGVEDVFAEEDGIMLYGNFPDFGKIQAYLEENEMGVLESGFERIPMDTKELSEDQVADVEKLLDKLEDNDDVLHVFHNMA